MIKYPNDDKIESKLQCALSHPSFLDGLSWLITVEHERAQTALINKGSRDTLFDFFIQEYIKRWHNAGKPIDLINELNIKREHKLLPS